MSVTWTPEPKPIEGKEDVFDEIANKLLDFFQTDEIDINDTRITPEIRKLLEEFATVSVSPYQTLNIPVIGKDPEATKYYLEKFREVYKKPFDPEKVVKTASGTYTTGMVTDCDGIPAVYCPEDDEAYDFDASFFLECLLVLDPFLLLESTLDKTPEQTLEFGRKLRSIADDQMAKHHCEYLRDMKEKPDKDAKEGHKILHFLLAASDWLIFWGSHGHRIRERTD